MISSIREILWNQFGASIDMLINVVANCPDDYYKSNKRFYYIAFHSAILLDYYLTIPPSDFKPFLSFTRMEAADIPKEALGDLVPDKVYAKDALVEYLKRSRAKCQALVQSLTDEKLFERFTEGNEPGDMDYPILEIVLYNMRHTQHHTAQLNMMIRQDFDKHIDWSFREGE